MLASLAGLMGIPVACDKPMFVEEYGCPEATYHVKGTVTNEIGQPVKGISVGWDTTDADGLYSVDFKYAFPKKPLSLAIRDIDSVENGSYNDTTVTINTENVTLHGGDGHWYEGEGTVTQNVVLKEKTNK